MQETVVAFFSHQGEMLTQHLIRNIYSNGALPFEKRMVIVPHLSLKSYLLQKLAEHPLLEIAAGIKVCTLSTAFSKIFEHQEKLFPNFQELSLSLQYEIMSLLQSGNDEAAPLLQYLDAPSFSLRMAQLSDLLSLTFLDYGKYEGKFLESWLQSPGWQQELWKRVFSAESPWTFHEKYLKKEISCAYSLHLFGFRFIPSLFLNFFKKLGTSFYFFSPCQYFWGDQYSSKEMVRHPVLEQEIDNPLLSNFGKVGRKLLVSALDHDLEMIDHYEAREEQSLLVSLQNAILQGTSLSNVAFDGSIQLLSASSKLREIEILYENIVDILEKEKGSIEPRDILVLAPDICDYAPYIQSVFDSSEMFLDYSISGLELRTLSPLSKAFEHLLKLPEKKFSKAAVLKLFSSSVFKEKFGFSFEDIQKIHEWIDRSNIRWGMDEKQREELLADGAPLEDAHMGTWEMGLDRLLHGMTQIDALSLNLVEQSDMELFDKMIKILHSLKEDLHPFYTQMALTIPAWFDYFVCLIRSYFNCESDDLIKELAHLARSLHHLKEHVVPFDAIQRILSSFLGRKSEVLQESHLHGIKFGSLSTGVVFPSKVIYLLGMQEGEFPRKNPKKMSHPDFAKLGNFHPSQIDDDRYFFLEILFSARRMCIMSYQRTAEEDQKKRNPSVVIEELCAYFANHGVSLSIQHHPAHPFDQSYFNEKNFHSRKHFAAAISYYTEPKNKNEPLIPEFYFPKKIEVPVSKELIIDIAQLLKFARHPLKFYFHDVLKMAIPSFQNKDAEGEFFLSPLMKKKLRDRSLKHSLSDLLRETEVKGELPRGVFKKIAVQTVKTDIETLSSCLQKFGISKEEVFSKEISVFPGSAKIVGKLEGISPKGLLFYGEDSITDLVKIWPAFLVYLHCFKENPSDLLLSKSGEIKHFSIKDPLASLQLYVDYYESALQSPSPLLPAFAESLLQGQEEELDKEIKSLSGSAFTYQDEILNWMILRDSAVSASLIHQNWSSFLRKTFQEALG